MTDQALARIEPGQDESGLTLRDHVYNALTAGYLPGIKSLDAAMTLVQKGRELGLQPMQALEGIHIIEGKPSLSASLIAGLITRAHGDDALIPVVWDNTQCTISFKRRTWTTRGEFTYTIDDAKRAGLVGKKPWTMNPASMLFARCVSTIGRRMFADALAGLGPIEDLDDVDEPQPGDLPERPVYDAAYWCKRWFTTVEGSRFDTDEAREDFIEYHTNGHFGSLKEFLQNHIEDAGQLIQAVETAIAVGNYSMLRDEPAPADYSEFADIIAPEMADAGRIRRNGKNPDPKPIAAPDGIDEPAPADDVPNEHDEISAWVASVRQRCEKAVSTKRGQGMPVKGDVEFVRTRLLGMVGNSSSLAKQLLADLTHPGLLIANDLRLGEAEVLRVVIATESDELRRYADRITPQGALL